MCRRWRFTADIGNVRVTGGKLEFYNSDGINRQCVLRHVRVGPEYSGGSSRDVIVQADVQILQGLYDAGIIVNYQDPENYGMVVIRRHIGRKSVEYREVINGSEPVARATSSSFSYTSGNFYTDK